MLAPLGAESGDFFMRSKLMVVGFVAIAAGLAVLVYSDTVLRLVLLDQGATTTLRTVTSTASTGGFPTGGFGTGGFGTGGFGGTGAITGVSAASALASASSSTITSIEENSAGFGLAAVGLVLAVVGSGRR
jgi:hypothetical protein